MSRIILMCLVFAIGNNLMAQSISLKGKVTDQSGKAVAGAVVTLKSKNLKDTTDATGAYSIVASTSSVNSRSIQSIAGEISMTNGIVAVHLTEQTRMIVELFDIKGSRLHAVIENTAKVGDYQFNLVNSPFAASILVVRVTIGQHVSNFRYIPSCINSAVSATVMSSFSGNVLAKAQAVTDTLQASALSYKTKKVAITSYTATTDFTLESEYTGTCIASKKHSNSSGTGPHKVVIETNSGDGIKEGTIFRPENLGPGKNYPIFIWGQGACSKDGLSASAAMSEIASHGYFVIADGTPGGGGTRNMDLGTMSKVGRAYATWIFAECKKPCSEYYQSVDTSKLAGNGFSCGGFLGQGFASDPRTTTWGVTSSGSFGDAPDLWKSVHTPVLILEGTKDVSSAGGTGAYDNGKRDYNGITALGKPAYFISNKNMGHGGDMFSAKNGGEFAKINLAWLNWWLKGDTGATGKGVLMGSTCKYCTDNNWEIKSANIP